MSELFHHERLEPSLLDRLTNDDPQQVTAFKNISVRVEAELTEPPANETELLTDTSGSTRSDFSGADRVYITARRLREIVKRDLTWLLNTGNLENVEDLTDYPLVARSVLNYGISDLTGISVANADVFDLERGLRRAIIQYEPRILPKSLRITVKPSGQMAQNALGFEIECDIWSQPSLEHLHLDLEIDLDTGAVGFSGDY